MRAAYYEQQGPAHEVLQVGERVWVYLARSYRPFGTEAARDLIAALATRELRYAIAGRYPLERIADAQDAAEQTGVAGRVVVEL